MKYANFFVELKGVHINEKQCDVTDISDQRLSADPLKAYYADAEITTIHIPCYSVVPHLFKAFVFKLSNIMGI